MAILLALILLVLVAAFFPGALSIAITLVVFGIGYAVFGPVSLVTMLLLMGLIYLAMKGDEMINKKRAQK